MEKHSWYKQMEWLRLCKYGFEVGITHMAKVQNVHGLKSNK